LRAAGLVVVSHVVVEVAATSSLRAEVDVVEASGGGQICGRTTARGLPPPWPNLGEGTNLRMVVLAQGRTSGGAL
jgi:hypothetical protein